MNALVLVRSAKKVDAGKVLGAAAPKASQPIAAQPKSWKPTAGVSHQAFVVSGLNLDEWHELQAKLRVGTIHTLLEMGEATDPGPALDYVFLKPNPMA